MILHLYFARRFVVSLLVIAGVLTALVVMVDLFDQTRRFSEFDIGFARLAELTLLNVPETLDQMLPLITILGTISLFLALARSSELVVTRATGRSAMRALLSPVIVVLIIGVFATTTLGPIVAATSKRYATLADSYRSGGISALSVSEDGLWLRQGDTSGQTVIRAARSNADASVLYDVTFVAYTRDGGPARRIEAASAALLDGEWSLRKAKVWPLASGLNPEATAAVHDLLKVDSTLTLDRIRESLGTPSGVSIWDMREFITQLELAGFSARKHEVWLQSQLARPLFLVAMVLIAAAFTMRHTRFGGTGTAVLAAVLLGFSLYFIRSFAQILGESGQIPVILSAWAAPLAAVLLGLGLLLRTEDG
ncbi:MAG: LPS export ABC transporter permease LptG [Tateyamaria sp.]|uniref:LPS export ABC transporter permease LptG n=1 Tax=Tateyamaria sp. TaxID=1929288 RepID=UPI00328AF383